MKKAHCFLCLLLLCLLCLSGCKASVPTTSSAGTNSDEVTATDKETSLFEPNIYQDTLLEQYGEMDVNQISLDFWDVTGDGAEEMIVAVSNGYAATVDIYTAAKQGIKQIYSEPFGDCHMNDRCIYRVDTEAGTGLFLYSPYVGCGRAEFSWTLFQLDQAGKQKTIAEDKLTWMEDAGSPEYNGEEPDIVAAREKFDKQVNTYLQGAFVIADPRELLGRKTDLPPVSNNWSELQTYSLVQTYAPSVDEQHCFTYNEEYSSEDDIAYWYLDIRSYNWLSPKDKQTIATVQLACDASQKEYLQSVTWKMDETIWGRANGWIYCNAVSDVGSFANFGYHPQSNQFVAFPYGIMQMENGRLYHEHVRYDYLSDSPLTCYDLDGNLICEIADKMSGYAVFGDRVYYQKVKSMPPHNTEMFQITIYEYDFATDKSKEVFNGEGSYAELFDGYAMIQRTSEKNSREKVIYQ